MAEGELEEAIVAARSAPSGILYQLRMVEVGQLLVSSRFREEQNKGERFHVVCSVEDFEGIGSGVRGELTRFGTVSYSCLWPQFRRLQTDPLIEVCPIHKAYHQPRPDKGYSLVVVCSNIGSVTPLVSVLTHLVYDRGFDDFERIHIMAPAVHVSARAEFETRIALDSVEWSPAIIDNTLGDGWTSFPGIGGNPIERRGLPKDQTYLQHMPDEVQRDLRQRRQVIRDQRLNAKDQPLI